MNEERKPISLQDIFNAAWQAFIVEDKPPAADEHGCNYLSKTGNKCAVGLCLPDGHSAQQCPGSFSILVERHPSLFDAQVKSLSTLQLNDFQASLHDSLLGKYDPVSGTRGWAGKARVRAAIYRVVAKAYNLTIPE
jgi:hypothetical protein